MNDRGPPPSQSSADRPRERLRAVGARHLSIRELLSLLVGSGTRGGSAFDVAARVLAFGEGSVRRLAVGELGELERIPGVGAATAARIVAALELGRRASAESTVEADRIRGPADVFRRMGPRLRDLPQEEFHALLLNTRHRVVREVAVTRGLLDASLIHPREVFRAAVTEGAAGIIIVHNHPSGDPTPSADDRSVTRQLTSAGKALGIPVLDHVIVGAETFTSLAEDEKWLD